jgi:hypothetical protein
MVNLTFCGFFFHLLVLVAMEVEEVTFGKHIYRTFGGLFPLSLSMKP